MNCKTSLLCSALTVSTLAGCLPQPAQAQTRPNIIFVLADDLGYGDIGVFFQNSLKKAGDRSKPWHSTPQLDAMAAQGVQLPQHYCSSPVCAPSRASFLSGLHQGHATVRDNQFDWALENNYTVANVLKGAGYATAAVGKWGLQGKIDDTAPHGWPAHPLNRGFDSYFGYIPHGAGHAHYPKEDGKRLFDGDVNVADVYDGCYTTDLFTARAKKWIGEHEKAAPQQPFFLYLALDTPHAKLQYPPAPFPAGGGLKGGVQWLGKPGQMINTAAGTPDSYCHPDYANATWDDDKNPATPEKPWPEVYKRYATDVRRIDDCIGDLNQLLKDLKIDDNTLVIFTSDNGPSQESYLPERFEANFFHSSGPFDGIKRDVWEGGIRTGAIARWPGKIPAGRISQNPSAFWDWLPTFADAAGVPAPARTDGISQLPSLTGKGDQKPSRLYFEYAVDGKTPSYPEFSPAHRGRVRQQMQALRIGNYMGIRYDIQSATQPFEIYDVVNDPQEINNLGQDPKFAALQKELQDNAIAARRPLDSAPRPYDDQLIAASKPKKTMGGLSWIAIQQSTPWLAQATGLKTVGTGTAAGLSGIEWPTKANEAIYSGFITVPKDGEYTFSLAPASKTLLQIHDTTVIDADFDFHPSQELKGTLKLKAGQHPFHFYTLKIAADAPTPSLKWGVTNAPLMPIPNSAFSH